MYKSIKDIVASLADSVEKLEEGTLSVEELETVLDDARALHERIAILQYLAVQPLPSVNGEPKKGTSFSFGVDQSVLNSLREPTNQTNLLDAIEEENKSDEKKPVSDLFDVPAPVAVPEPKTPEIPEVPKELQTPSKEAEKPLNSEEGKEMKSVNDKFSSQREVETLADKLSKKPITDLGEAIGLNQKFLFMNDLFEGENNLYKEAVNTLNNFSSFIEADEYINVLKSRHGWDNTSSTVKSFMELVERRYS